MALPNFVIKYAMEKTGAYLGGPIGMAVAALGTTTAFAEAALGSLALKLNDQTARWSDVVLATSALESALYSVGIFGASVGSATVLAPGELVGMTIISAGILGLYYQNPVAVLDAFDALWTGIGKDEPWTFAANAMKAYSAEIERQKVIDQQTNTATTQALNWVAPRKDPLVLDLDGGGISTSAINPASPIYFDQDGDGTLTATGWIASGEAIVVRDLNGNGLIDSGRELFGDSTVLTRGTRAGQRAANGFEALADLDANASGVSDGKFDANDAAFASVRLWKDANQDGISQAGELYTFAQLGVASINVTGTASNVNLGGGNTQTFAGSFTRVGGTVGDAGTAELAGSLLLANNNFYRQFSDDPAVTATAQALPQMTGSGWVRDSYSERTKTSSVENKKSHWPCEICRSIYIKNSKTICTRHYHAHKKVAK